MSDKSDNDCTEQKPWQFKPGQSGNPGGRPRGSIGGRARSLQILDEITSKEENQQLLAAKMEEAFRRNPMAFFQKVMVGVMPKESLNRIITEPTTKQWGSLRDMMEQDSQDRQELNAVIKDYPGQEVRILEMIAKGIPMMALRIQLGRPPRPCEPAARD